MSNKKFDISSDDVPIIDIDNSSIPESLYNLIIGRNINQIPNITNNKTQKLESKPNHNTINNENNNTTLIKTSDNNENKNKIVANKEQIETEIINKQQTKSKQITNKVAKTLRQTYDKPTTNLRQTCDNSSNKPTTKLRQSYDKVTTEKKQKTETYDKPTTQPTTQPTTNLRQTCDKLATEKEILSLVGVQRNILIFLYNLCRSNGIRSTSPLPISLLASVTQSKIKSIQKSILRLIKTGIIIRENFKNGRGGWTIYSIPENVYQILFKLETCDKLATNIRQTCDKPTTQPTTQPTTSFSSSSSSSNILNTTTTTREDEKQKKELSPEWENIDISSLEEIGFKKGYLQQIFERGELSAEIVQNCIYYFAFDLKENEKAKELKTSPLNFFMGILGKGKIYNEPANYENPQDKSMRLYLENQKKRKEVKEKMEQELFDLEFETWYDQLTLEQVEQYLPKELKEFIGKLEKKHPGKKSTLKDYFKENIWVEKKKTLSF